PIVRLIEHLLSTIDGSDGGVWEMTKVPGLNGSVGEPHEPSEMSHVDPPPVSHTHFENGPSADPDIIAARPEDSDTKPLQLENEFSKTKRPRNHLSIDGC
ncbi:hypothetical protein PENTCL1PPCAC_29460, partial [Pristionchus entomophagus]